MLGKRLTKWGKTASAGKCKEMQRNHCEKHSIINRYINFVIVRVIDTENYDPATVTSSAKLYWSLCNLAASSATCNRRFVASSFSAPTASLSWDRTLDSSFLSFSFSLSCCNSCCTYVAGGDSVACFLLLLLWEPYHSNCLETTNIKINYLKSYLDLHWICFLLYISLH